MKKYIISALALTAMMGFTACNSDDPMESTSKHVYAEGEAPYLRTNTQATASFSLQFPLASIEEPQTIDLKQCASIFHKNLNMTLDETINALENGTVVMYNINPSRGCWDLTPANCGLSGWNYNSYGIAQDPAEAIASVEFDADAKALVVKMFNEPAVGSIVNVHLGFAKPNGKDFDTYCRVSIDMAVTNPGTVITSVNLPQSGGYQSTTISFDDFKEDIEYSMKMSLDDFCAIADDSSVLAMTMEDANGNWLTGYNYTAGSALSYWLGADFKPTGWDGSGWPNNTFFIETYGEDRSVGIGTSAANNVAGSYLLRFNYSLVDDPDTFVEFIVTVNVSD